MTKAHSSLEPNGRITSERVRQIEARLRSRARLKQRL